MSKILVSIFIAVIFISGCSQKYNNKVTKAELKSSRFDLIADVIYGHDFGLALTYDVYLPANPSGAVVVLINSGGCKSPYDTLRCRKMAVIDLLAMKKCLSQTVGMS
jgi:hypothetical protein